MKFRIESSELSPEIGWTAKSLSPRASQAYLHGIHLTAADGLLTIEASDGQTRAVATVPCAVEQPGEALVMGRVLANLVSKLPGGVVNVETDGTYVDIECGTSHFRLRAMDASDWVDAVEGAEDVPSATMATGLFERLVAQVAPAASGDEAKPVLTGVHLELADDDLVAAATDSYRLAARTISVGGASGVSTSRLVPADALQEAARAIRSEDATVEVSFPERGLVVRVGSREVRTALIEGTFPEWKRLIPDDDAFTMRVEVDRAALSDALSRVAVVTSGAANSPVRLAASADGSLMLSASSQELGDANENVAAKVVGEGAVELAFNPAFLSAALSATGAERVEFKVIGSVKPVLVDAVPEEGEDAEPLTYLLMPMRVS